MESLIIFIFIFLGVFLFILHSKVENQKKDIELIKSKLKEKGFDFRSEFEITLDNAIPQQACAPQKQTEEHDFVEQNLLEEEAQTVEFVSEEPQSAETEPQEELEISASGIEKLFLGNVFNKVGAVILVIAFCIFIKIVSENFVFTPAMRIAIGYILGLGLCGVSLKIHKDQLINYSEVLLGIGFSILFITMYCSAALYNMINAPTMCAIASLVLFGAYFVAQRYNSFSTIAIGLVGAYLCPAFITASSINLLLIFLLYVNAITLIYTYKNPSKNMLDYINIVLVALTVSDKNMEVASSFVLALFYLAYVVKHWLVSRSQEHKKNALLYTAQVVFPGIIIANNWYDNIELARVYTFAFFVFALGLYFLLRKYDKRNDGYVYSSMIPLFCGVLILEKNIPILFGSSVIAVLLIWLSNKFEFKALSNWGYSFIAYPILLAFILKPDSLAQLPDCVSKISLLLLIPLLASVVSYFISKKYDNFEYAKVYKFISITLGYYILAHAVVTYIQTQYATQLDKSYPALTWVSVGLLYSLNAIYAREKDKLGVLEIVGYCAYGLSMLVLTFTLPKYETIPFCNLPTLVAMLGVIVTVLINKIRPQVFYPYIATLLGFWMVCVNVLNAIEYDKFNAIVLSLSWAVYSGALLLWGILKNVRACKMVGIGIAILTVLRIFIIDMVNAELVQKLLGFLILGIVLMAVSYVYAKKKN